MSHNSLCTVEGVCHGDELGYFFYRNYTIEAHNDLYNYPREMTFVDKVTTMWAHFAAYGYA